MSAESNSVFRRATTATTELTPGSRLDRYELLVSIAQGGFGEVWLARLQGKRGFEKLVAIKVPRLTGDVHFQGMLLDEARIAAAIEHDNVCKILELGEQGEILYIVMEWIDGEPVSTLLRALDKKKTPFPLPLALRIVTDMCSAAHAAHELRGPDGTELGVVHRDISPQNMLITSTGSVKLIDFGIAKAKDRASGDTTDGTLKGKVKYMAPEQVVGASIDRRADVFALGAVLHRFLSGQSPFESDNEVQTLHRLANGSAPNPLPPDVPIQVRRILDKSLALQPDARFRTALEMHDALMSTMEVLGINVTPRDLARFNEEHLKDRLERRRVAVDAAVKAAHERAARGVDVQVSEANISAMKSLFPQPLSSSSVNAARDDSGQSGSASTSLQSNSGVSQTTGPSEASSLFAHDVGPNSVHPRLAAQSPPKRRSGLWLALLALGAIGIGLIAFVATQGSSMPWSKTAAASVEPPASAPITPPSIADSPSPPPTFTSSTSASAAASSRPASSSSTIAHRGATPPPPPAKAPPPPANPGHVAKPPPKPAGTATTDFGY